ncbi:uncharacterized protein Nmag_0141 [Natrialba magadii ATCC 43099]|uniref:Uncharacterized protein n=1 Tax=Natrialba magadii (strain ATCC 43099 / DSM 3394 / CCM 3739 / CIP 104546 / IAM 13178 / JCM 8861 / NBRC 102185 / NCIMB 2190 / MS3) TaxID=547559 RepID=D3SWE4_NATMM|nr:hypothetical protein [Natrialba magadii]ADD03736.1 uncharacterized protein Nmag_0141 [Natrialba magadii ATCC 43099]ELY33791.1 hypothetical protein C500_01158 [Natrialba magadii ATCC 43099]
MRTIEIIGPSGAGKTTYAMKTSERENFHRNLMDLLDSKTPIRSPFRRIPKRDEINHIFFSIMGHYYGKKFTTQYPGVLETTAEIIRNYNDKHNVLDFVFREAAQFEFFSCKLGHDDIYLCDDGLYQFHLRLLVLDKWGAKDIMDRLPIPDKLIFVDAPPIQCLERQETRPRGRTSRLENVDESTAITELDKMRSASLDFISEAKRRNVNVEIIDNGEGSFI